MTFKQITAAIYALAITNYYGFKLRKISDYDNKAKKQCRYSYSYTLLTWLNIKIEVVNKEKLPKDGQYLLVSNHRTIIDPLIVELALKDTNVYGKWVAKKELYNSFFFGLFTRNVGTVLLDRESKNMSQFFKAVKKVVKEEGASMCMFPEGTRNQTAEKLTEFKAGSQIIALKNRLPILPVFIKGRSDLILKDAINNRPPMQTIEVEFGDLIDPKDRSVSLQENYEKQFNLAP